MVTENYWTGETGTVTVTATAMEQPKRTKLQILVISGALKGMMKEFSSYDAPIKVGKLAPKDHLKLLSKTVSREHGEFVYDGQNWSYWIPPESTMPSMLSWKGVSLFDPTQEGNGYMYNEDGMPLNDGDVFEIGHNSFEFNTL